MAFQLGDILSLFPGPDVAKALVRAGLPGAGTRLERLERLRSNALRHGWSAVQVLDCFSAESLRRVALRLDIRAPSKAEMISGIAALLAESQMLVPNRGAATLGDLKAYIASLAGSYRGLRDEADAELFLSSALSDHFEQVRTQVAVPGLFGHRIDIDIQAGRFGIEVKFAPAVIESSSEAYRLLGQAFYYDRRRYAGRLLVVIVGQPALEAHPIIGEIIDLLGALGVAGVYLPVD